MIFVFGGLTTPAQAPFRVTDAGQLYASTAILAGSLSWASGKGTANSNGISVEAYAMEGQTKPTIAIAW